MIIPFIIVTVLVAHSLFTGINEALPSHVPEQDLWLIDVVYRLLNVGWAIFLGEALTSFHRERPMVIGCAICYVLAVAVRLITWHLAYKDWL